MPTERRHLAVDPERPSTLPQRSGRHGPVVYYVPDDRGPYVDLQDALGDVPDGGFLQLGVANYDVSTEGRLSIHRPVHVCGVGYSQFNTPDQPGRGVGSKLLNVGEDAVDGPALEYAPPSGRDRLQSVRVESLQVSHTADSAPAVRFRDTARSLLWRCLIDCGHEAPTGVVYEGDTDHGQQRQNTVQRFSDVGIHVTAGGRGEGPTGHEFQQTVSTSSFWGATALRTESNRSIVVGGEYAVFDGRGTAIEFYNPTDEPRSGGLVLEPGIERTGEPVVVDGDATFEGVQLYHTFLPLGEGAGVYFGNAAECSLVNPVVPRGAGGQLVHWSEQSNNCTVLTDPATLARCTYADDGARNPHVHVVGSAPSPALDVFPTGVPTTVTYNPETGRPVLHDGDRWHQFGLAPTNDREFR